MVLPERVERLEWPGIQASGGRLVLAQLQSSTAAAPPGLSLVSKVRCCPLLQPQPRRHPHRTCPAGPTPSWGVRPVPSRTRGPPSRMPARHAFRLAP